MSGAPARTGETPMANKEECDRFAAEMARRFDEFTAWARSNWPNKDFPLLDSDFDASRKEMQQILGDRLNEGRDEASQAGAGGVGPRADDGSVQYVNMNPAPWP
jgi:hypothetical protein